MKKYDNVKDSNFPITKKNLQTAIFTFDIKQNFLNPIVHLKLLITVVTNSQLLKIIYSVHQN